LELGAAAQNLTFVILDVCLLHNCMKMISLQDTQGIGLVGTYHCGLLLRSSSFRFDSAIFSIKKKKKLREQCLMLRAVTSSNPSIPNRFSDSKTKHP
jgi:hypothetical protein